MAMNISIMNLVRETAAANITFKHSPSPAIEAAYLAEYSGIRRPNANPGLDKK